MTEKVMREILRNTESIADPLERSVERQVQITGKILDGFGVGSKRTEAIKLLWRHSANASAFQSKLLKKGATLQDALTHYEEHADSMEQAHPHVTPESKPLLRKYVDYLRGILPLRACKTIT